MWRTFLGLEAVKQEGYYEQLVYQALGNKYSKRKVILLHFLYLYLVIGSILTKPDNVSNSFVIWATLHVDMTCSWPSTCTSILSLFLCTLLHPGIA